MESARAWEVNSGRPRKTKGESMELQPSLVHSIQVRDHALPPKPPCYGTGRTSKLGRRAG
jgi:hypothetical protein